MAKVTVGGKEYEVPEMNFLALERCWPHVEEAMTTLDPIKGPAAGIRIIAAGLMEADHFKPTDFGIGENETLGDEQTFERVTHFLKKRIKANEIEGVRTAVNEITKEAGLEEAEQGEAPPTPPQGENPSGETAQTTSPSSSPPDAKEGAGS